MNFSKLKTAAASIILSEEAKHHIINNCKTQIHNSEKETKMKTTRHFYTIKKPILVFTVLALCLSLSALAASGVLQGFFQDITDPQGVVTGSSYEQASDEILISAAVKENELIATASFVQPQAAPYSEVELLGIAAYQILDDSGKTVAQGAADPAVISNEQAAIIIRLDDVANGSYKLIVTSFVAEKKADQPLLINGCWECSFTK